MAENNPNQPSSSNPDDAHFGGGQNVIERLRQRIRDAKGMGIRIRSEWLDDQQATWCEIGGVKTIFIDLSQSATEQLEQLEESLASLASDCRAADSPPQRAA
jgi:hypothetical protein